MTNAKLLSLISQFMMAFLLITPLSLDAQQEWITFQADDNLPFSIEVPAVMGMKNKTITTQIGDLSNTTYALERNEDESPNFLYMVTMIDYPQGVFDPDSIELIDTYLTEAISSLADGVNGEVLYQTDIKEDKNGRGKLFRLRYDEEYMIIKGKTFIKNDVFITVQVYTTKDKSLNDEMDVFLDSFEIRE